MGKRAGNDSEQTIRLTLRWVALAIVLLFGIGIVGGLVGQQLLAPPVPPLSNTDQLVTQVQEVTISPNTAAAQVVDNAERSVVVLGLRVGATIQPMGTAAIVTNDGLVASTIATEKGEVVALDDTGAAVALDLVGVDPMYGISYWRMPAAVVVPLDLRREPVPVGTELLALSRSETTRRTRVLEYRAQELTLPRAEDAPGVQQLVQGTELLPELFVGAPLIDDDGRLAGLILDAGGQAVGAETLQLSLNRVSRGERELDPLDRVGLDLEFSFTTLPATPDRLTFTPRITAVTPNSPASAARLQRGDIILTINDDPTSWEKNVLQQLSATLPLKITVQRGEAIVPVTVVPAAAP